MVLRATTSYDFLVPIVLPTTPRNGFSIDRTSLGKRHCENHFGASTQVDLCSTLARIYVPVLLAAVLVRS